MPCFIILFSLYVKDPLANFIEVSSLQPIPPLSLPELVTGTHQKSLPEVGFP